VSLSHGVDEAESYRLVFKEARNKKQSNTIKHFATHTFQRIESAVFLTSPKKMNNNFLLLRRAITPDILGSSTHDLSSSSRCAGASRVVPLCLRIA